MAQFTITIQDNSDGSVSLYTKATPDDEVTPACRLGGELTTYGIGVLKEIITPMEQELVDEILDKSGINAANEAQH